MHFDDSAQFWRQFNQLRKLSSPEDRTRANTLIARIGETYLTGDQGLDAARLELLEHLAQTFGLEHWRPAPNSIPLLNLSPGRLPGISSGGIPGVSLVTCCMNREVNLLRALVSWLACPDITEIIIVDWSSDQPVQDALKAQGISDPKIRVVRVEKEPRWILSYAFNVGFRVASCDKILKADADIVLKPDFFAKNQLIGEGFIAGNWRTAAKDQAHVNGFFYLHKADLATVSGFNEYITTYGWDDDDLYERLEQRGLVRCDIRGDTVHHLPHSDSDRLGEQGSDKGPPPSGMVELRNEPLHKIRQNRFIANVMPVWRENKTLHPFEVREGKQDNITLRRESWSPHSVPAHINASAWFFAALEITAWRLGARVFELERDRLELLLDKPFSELGRIDVEVALGNRPETVRTAKAYLVVRYSAEFLPADNPAGIAFDALLELAKAQHLTPVLSSTSQQMPKAAQSCPYIPNWRDISPLETITPAQLADLGNLPLNQHFEINLDESTIAALNAPELSKAAPVLAINRHSDCREIES